MSVSLYIYFSGERVYRFLRGSVCFGNYLVTNFKPLFWGAQFDLSIIGPLQGEGLYTWKLKFKPFRETKYLDAEEQREEESLWVGRG